MMVLFVHSNSVSECTVPLIISLNLKSTFVKVDTNRRVVKNSMKTLSHSSPTTLKYVALKLTYQQ